MGERRKSAAAETETAAQVVGEIIQRMGKLLQKQEAERDAAFVLLEKSRKRLLDMAGVADWTAAGYRRILEDIRKGGSTTPSSWP